MRFTIISSSQLGDNWSAEYHIAQEEQAMTEQAAPALVLERKDQQDKQPAAPGLLITPDLDENYWSYRVKLTEKQAVVGFPKFGIIGIGYAVEGGDWNRNLPADDPAEKIAECIAVNKGDDSIDNDTVLRAITMIQLAVQAAKLERIVQSLKQPAARSDG